MRVFIEAQLHQLSAWAQLDIFLISRRMTLTLNQGWWKPHWNLLKGKEKTSIECARNVSYFTLSSEQPLVGIIITPMFKLRNRVLRRQS